MNQNCPICMQPLRPDGLGVTRISAAGRGIVSVHSGHCASIAGKAARTVAHGALFVARKALAAKAPLLSRMLEEFAAHRRKERQRLERRSGESHGTRY